MAACHYTLCCRFSKSGLNSLADDLSTARSPAKLVNCVKLPILRLTCSALAISKTLKQEVADKVRGTEFELPLSSVSLDRGNEADRAANGASLFVERSPWQFLQDAEGKVATSKLPWMDPSLRYANVMWFKGSYNAQILVGENESDESVVRRFRRAVMEAGVIRECHRRRYRETPQDVIKRKHRQAAMDRKRKPRYGNNAANSWRLQRDTPSISRQSKSSAQSKKKKKKDTRTRTGSERLEGVTKGGSANGAETSDEDDFWGYAEDEEDTAVHR